METQAKKPKYKMFQSYLIISNINNSVDDLTSHLEKLNLEFSQKSPDVATISPTEGSISIDEIRNLKKQLYQKPIYQKQKIVVIKDADKLTTEAQNALLKVLEEPPSHAILILIAHSSKNLLPTINSRIVTINAQKDQSLQKNKEELDISSQTFVSTLENALSKDPNSWISSQMLAYYKKLLKTINNKDERQKILKLLEQTQETKKMINANVNARFAIANLILGTLNDHQN
ncbi:MAG: DNA-directed DNA polymerase [Candidatus Curtissbacteria bacterium GW2011_GWA1_40_9]|uniref:DNA-directed DNA polymerase n=1 Tax=Candidatus Curtissbacteria bacterium GW2011_GWA1_40_9 TaxID=1618408 RepID=A0A0G0TMQ9_9BACT|nr:MAG: DNA-directed DNA polymerase [Candidatus Curtissbacteria bacterium GW2011_GWA1_40_9]